MYLITWHINQPPNDIWVLNHPSIPVLSPRAHVCMNCPFNDDWKSMRHQALTAQEYITDLFHPKSSHTSFGTVSLCTVCTVRLEPASSGLHVSRPNHLDTMEYPCLYSTFLPTRWVDKYLSTVLHSHTQEANLLYDTYAPTARPSYSAHVLTIGPYSAHYTM